MAFKFLMLLFLLIPSWALENRDYLTVDKLYYDQLQFTNESSDANSQYKKVFKAYSDIAEKIHNESSTAGRRYFNSINSLSLWTVIQNDMNIVDGIYTKFVQELNAVIKTIKPVNLTEWLSFADVVTNHPDVSISGALQRISQHIIEDNFFIIAYKEVAAQICNEVQSPQQLLYNLYEVIAMAEFKGHMMMQFAYKILRHDKNGTFEGEEKKAQKDYENRVSKMLRTVRTAMAFAPKDLWRCDPVKHVEDITYIELKQLFQGYIVNEVDLNPTSTCRENCAFYTYAKVHGCYDNLYCAQQRKCNGKVINCRYIDSDMWICPSTKDNRRYEYIEYENGKVYGSKDTCKRPTTKVDSWWRWLFWHCSYCMCYCDDHNSSSDRYFNLRNITSDVMRNKVITGMRFKKVNQIIHIQIQEGQLIQRGKINSSSLSWQPVDNFTTLDRNARNGRDFHTLSWEKRAIDLDDLPAPDSHVVTGVRFRMVGSHLNFEIRITPFNFTTGQLIKPMETSIWRSNDNTDIHGPSTSETRTELEFNEPDIPIRAKAQSFPDSKSNQFLKFGPSDIKKDVAQTTIPFLDIQPVITNPPSPLAGAGVFHKGREGYGGYVALKVMTYDFSKHIVSEFNITPIISDSNEGITVNEIPSVK